MTPHLALARSLLAWIALGTPLASGAASSDAAARNAVNDLRARGCDGRPGVTTQLRSSRQLDAIAEKLAAGAALRAALANGKYRVERSASIHIAHARADPVMERMLRGEFCVEATDPEFREIGVALRGADTWIVLALPFNPPLQKDAPAVSFRVLELVNQARASQRRCGGDALPAAPPLRLNAALNEAARAHALDLPRRGSLSHKGSDGSTPAQRATRAHYAWRTVAENVAAGQTTPEAAVKSWLDSPSHCANLMSTSYTEMGVAYVVDVDSPDGIYWAQLFAAPR